MRPPNLPLLMLVVCLSLGAALPCAASGGQEKLLIEAKRLYDEKNYDQALLLLTQLERENPDLRDETRAVMFRIFDIRRQYNEKYGQLIDVLANQRDVDKGLALINELEALDPRPNPATLASITQARKTVEFTVNLNHFNILMDTAEKLITQGKYSEALAMYLQPVESPETLGYDLHRRDFLQAGYGEAVQTKVFDTLRSISGTTQNVRKADAGLASAMRAEGALLDSPKVNEAAVSRFVTGLAALRAVVDMESGLRRREEELGATGEAIVQRKNSDGKRDLYVRYMSLICLGRKEKSEGIIHVTRLIWEKPAQGLADKAFDVLGATFANAKKIFDVGEFESAALIFSEIPSRGVMAAEALGTVAAGMQPGPGLAFLEEEKPALRRLIGRAAVIQETVEESSAYRALCGYRLELALIPSSEAAAPAALPDWRTKLQERIGETETFRRNWQGREKTLLDQARVVESLSTLSRSARGVADLFEGLIRELQLRDLGFALRIARIQEAAFPPRLEVSAILRAQATDLMNGTRNGRTVENEFVPKEPSKALGMFKKAGDDLARLRVDIDSYRNEWTSDKPYVNKDERLAALISAAADVQKRAAAEADLISSLSRTAQDQHNRAAEQEKLGDQYFERARALSDSDPETAQDVLMQAEDAYGKSLDYEEKDSLKGRMNANGEVGKLRTKLANAVNRKIISEVDGLISDGIVLFKAGKSREASLKFTQADERWKEKLPGDMYPQDLKYYLALSKAALSISGSREILPTDASYNVVSSYINLANQKYQEAESNVQSGRKEEAVRSLRDAKSNVNSVLQLFPNNRVARILDLRILKLTDEKAFPSQLMAQKDGYMKGLKEKSISDREAYLGLSNIQEFLPKDTALAKTIDELEIKIGLKPEPISQARLNKSVNLYQQAYNNYRKEEPITYQSSLKLLDQSLEANPNNDKARKLRTTILMQSGSQVEGLSRKNMADYLKAKDLLNSGSIRDAKIIVDRLWRDPKAANYPPLMELKNKIDARVGGI